MPTGYAVSRVLDIHPHLDPSRVAARLGYASFASLEERLVYVEVPKAACTSMRVLLRDLLHAAPLTLYPGVSRETHRSMFVHARENAPLPALTTLPDAAQRELLESDDVLRLTVVRNPYTRLVSAWRDKVYLCEPTVEDVYAAIRGGAPAAADKRPIQFEEFVAHVEHTIDERCDAHWRRQVDLSFPRALAYTHIGRTENLGATVDLVAHHLRRQRPAVIPRANMGALRPPPHYTETLARRVHAIYATDFDTFGYDDDAWPRGEENRPLRVAEERFVDAVVERNVIIRHLYRERERLAAERDVAYRWSLARVRDALRRLFGANGRA